MKKNIKKNNEEYNRNIILGAVIVSGMLGAFTGVAFYVVFLLK